MKAGDVAQVGLWSSIAVAAMVALFGLVLVVGFWAEVGLWVFPPPLLLAPVFVAMMTAVHHQAPPEKRVWSHLAVVFAGIYAVMVTITYYVQLTVVRSTSPAAVPGALGPFLFAPGSVLFAVDMLGYAFMTLSTWVAAPVFAGDRLSVWIRRWLILHGLFVFPTLAAPALRYGDAAGGPDVGALALVGWCLIFLPIPIMLALHFVRLGRD